jgi:ribonuclease HIII
VLDQFVESNKYYEYFEKIKTHPYSITKFVTGAEKKYLAVAAASIIARIKFLEQIKQLQNKSCAKIYLGASNPKIIPSAKQIYQQGGIDLLKRFVKIDFKTTKQVIG